MPSEIDYRPGDEVFIAVPHHPGITGPKKFTQLVGVIVTGVDRMLEGPGFRVIPRGSDASDALFIATRHLRPTATQELINARRNELEGG